MTPLLQSRLRLDSFNWLHQINSAYAAHMNSVLIIEDDERITELLEIHLRELDCRTTTVGNRAEGLRLAMREAVRLQVS